MNRLITTVALLCCMGLCGANAQNYTPVKGKLMTSWGETITPENAWREYPRPQLKRAKWQNLNGLWEYAIIAKDASKPSQFQGTILVPFAVESALSGVSKSVLPEQKLWYRRSFEIPQNWTGQSIVLHFEAVDWETSVWVNGKLARTHKGGSTAFAIDITKFLKKGKQELVVSVWDPTDQGDQPRGKQVLDPKGIWYTPVTGIWQTVWMEPVSPSFIRSVYPVADIDHNKVSIQKDIWGLKGGEQLQVKVSYNKQTVVEKSFPATDDISLDIPSPKLWSPDSPELYQVELSLSKGGKVLDQVESYFAMRKVSISKDEFGYLRLQLNNQTVFQYGTLDQGWWPDGLLTPPSTEAMRYDMEILKQMGFNMLRKHIKVEPALYYYYADSMGLLIWQDMVSGFETEKRNVQHVRWDAPTDWARPTESALQVQSEMKEEMDQLKFFPSIVTWVIFNEGWGQFDTKRLVEWSMNYDKTRVIDGVSGWMDQNCGNMYDVHQYPGPGMEPAELNPGRVMTLGEFGGLGLPIENHLWNPNMRNWGYRIYSSVPELIKEYGKLMYNLYPMRSKGLSAAVYTQTTDVEGEVNGLMTYDRKVIKIDPELLRILHAPLYAPITKKAENLLADSEIKSQVIRFTKTKPEGNWTINPDFSKFESKNGPIELRKKESVWAANTFDLKEIPAGISLKILAYGDVTVYLNGQKVLNRKIIGKRHYEDFNITGVKGYLRKGKNVIAIEAPEFELDAPFDFGVYTY